MKMGDRNLCPEILAFARIMQAKLDENSQKDVHEPRVWMRGWKHERPDWLMNRLQKEVRELEIELAREPITSTVPDRFFLAQKIACEAADVANMAMMIADVCEGLPGLEYASEPGEAA